MFNPSLMGPILQGGKEIGELLHSIDQLARQNSRQRETQEVNGNTSLGESIVLLAVICCAVILVFGYVAWAFYDYSPDASWWVIKWLIIPFVTVVLAVIAGLIIAYYWRRGK